MKREFGLSLWLLIAATFLSGTTFAARDPIEQLDRVGCAWLVGINARRPGFAFLDRHLETHGHLLLADAKAAAFQALGDEETLAVRLPTWNDLGIDPQGPLDQLMEQVRGTTAFRRHLTNHEFNPEGSPFSTLFGRAADRYLSLLSPIPTVRGHHLAQLKARTPAEQVAVVIDPLPFLQTAILRRLSNLENAPVFLGTDRYSPIKSGALLNAAAATHYYTAGLRAHQFRPDTSVFHVFGGTRLGEPDNYGLRFAVNDIVEAAFKRRSRRTIEIHFYLDTTSALLPGEKQLQVLAMKAEKMGVEEIGSMLRNFVVNISATESWTIDHKPKYEYSDEMTTIYPDAGHPEYRIELGIRRSRRKVNFIFH